MKIAITGGTGFVGRHLTVALLGEGHEAIIVARGIDRRDTSILGSGARFVAASTDDAEALRRAFSGCDAVAHFAGINREIGAQTYERVHVQGTRAVVDAARAAGATKIVYLSFLRARPACGSPYHESKWAAEELVRGSGIDHTILKSGVIYGRGDHLLDHVSRALYTFPVFPLVGLRPTRLRPVYVGDDVLCRAHPRGASAGRSVRPPRPARFRALTPAEHHVPIVTSTAPRVRAASEPPATSLDLPVTRIPGIGSESAKLLERMKIQTIGDLLWHL